jgi:hypothetical protein
MVHQALRIATASRSRRTGHFWPGCKKYIYVRPLGMLLRNGNDASICRYNENESPPPFLIFTRSVELTPINPHHMPSDLCACTQALSSPTPSPCSTAFDMNIRSPHQTHRRTHALKTAGGSATHAEASTRAALDKMVESAVAAAGLAVPALSWDFQPVGSDIYGAPGGSTLLVRWTF